MCEREERIPMPELSPETNGEKRERWQKSPKSSGGGGLYRVRHPRTSYVTKWSIDAIMPAHNKTVMLTIGPRISE